jgi:hypothetical protein
VVLAVIVDTGLRLVCSRDDNEKGSDRNGPVVRSLGWRVGVSVGTIGSLVTLIGRVVVVVFMDPFVGLSEDNMLSGSLGMWL